MDVLAYPFRFTGDGRAALVVQGSDAHLAQQSSQYLLTRPKELPLALGYGLVDPTFRKVTKGEIIAGLATYHPDIIVNDVQFYGANQPNLQIDVLFDNANNPAPKTRFSDPLAGVTFGGKS